MKISYSKIVSPSKELAQSLNSHMSIQLWRTSDIFEENDGKRVIIHYDLSFVYEQQIDRTQVWSYKLDYNFKKDKLKFVKIGLVEKLTSNQQTIGFNELNEKSDFKFYKEWKKEAKGNRMGNYSFDKWLKDFNVP